MELFFQLVELTSGNVADDFASLDEAVEAVGAAVRQYSADAIRTYSLIEFANDSSTLVAMEDELLDLVARRPIGTLAST